MRVPAAPLRPKPAGYLVAPLTAWLVSITRPPFCFWFFCCLVINIALSMPKSPLLLIFLVFFRRRFMSTVNELRTITKEITDTNNVMTV